MANKKIKVALKTKFKCGKCYHHKIRSQFNDDMLYREEKICKQCDINIHKRHQKIGKKKCNCCGIKKKIEYFNVRAAVCKDCKKRKAQKKNAEKDPARTKLKTLDEDFERKIDRFIRRGIEKWKDIINLKS